MTSYTYKFPYTGAKFYTVPSVDAVQSVLAVSGSISSQILDYVCFDNLLYLPDTVRYGTSEIVVTMTTNSWPYGVVMITDNTEPDSVQVNVGGGPDLSEVTKTDYYYVDGTYIGSTARMDTKITVPTGGAITTIVAIITMLDGTTHPVAPTTVVYQ